jgi:hypothetical protein
MVFQNLTPYSLVEVPIILIALYQVPEDGKLHICNDGTHRTISVNFGQATTKASLFLPYKQEQRVKPTTIRCCVDSMKRGVAGLGLGEPFFFFMTL